MIVVYREESEHARAVREFLHDYLRRTGRQIETLSPDTKEGADFCRRYDIMAYPAVVEVSHDGVLRYIRQGMPLPLIDEVSYYDANR